MTKLSNNQIRAIAQTCHIINRVYCEGIGDFSQQGWEYAEAWQRQSAIEGVEAVLKGFNTPETLHEQWCASKRRDGWVWGEKKDPEAKTHPCLVSYDALPEWQRVKDTLFFMTVKGCASHMQQEKDQ